MRVFRLTRALLPRWHEQLEALEQLSQYPLGADTFRISHGTDYFKFFQRMGEVAYYAVEEDGQLVAVACGVLRSQATGRAWYLCDAKVRPSHRGRHLPLRMLRYAFLHSYLRCGRAYGVAMNPTDGRVPPAVRLLEHFAWMPSSMIDTLQLDLYAADATRMRDVRPLLEHGRGPLHFVSLRGIKDLTLASTGASLDLLHVSFGVPRDQLTYAEPQPGHVHMWCTPRSSPWTARLAAGGLVPSASATVVSHRMQQFDGSIIETSEI